MCSLACRPLALLLATLVLSATAWAQTTTRPSIEDFPRADAPGALIATGVVPPAAPPVWDNGPPDDVTAHAAQNAGPAGFFKVADDIIIKDAQDLFLHEIEVCFLVSQSIDGVMCKPNVALDILDDCDARPNNVITTVSDPDRITAINDGPSATFPGFNEWRFIFRVEQTFSGYQRLWIAPFGIADFGADMESCQGYYFWRSANNGTIQGAQGQIKNANDPWMDAEDCGCPDYCTDFCFTIRGHRCCLVADNTPFFLDGSPSLQLKGALIQTARAVDNFQIGPHAPARLCAVEAWMATNCNTDKIFLEIYDNDCDTPVGITPIHVIDDGDVEDPDLPDFPIAQDTGADFAGCNVYRLLWPNIQGITLDPGKNYWLAVVARGNGGINDKAHWMHLGVFSCNRHITEGQVRDPFVEGLEDFTPISIATQFRGSIERDLAFRLWIDAAAPTPLGACCLPSGLCADTSEPQCTDMGGGFTPGIDCAVVSCAPPLVGACCLPSGLCTDISESQCTDMGGGFSPGINCAVVLCARISGACCTAATCIDNLTEDECTSTGGLAWFEAQTCNLATCADHILGACCQEAFGICTDLSLTDCAGVSGALWSDGQLCASVSCDPPPPGGACCTNAACIDNVSQDECLNNLGGLEWTTDLSCAQAACSSCCIPPACLANTTLADCNTLSGTFSPAPCGVAPCNPIGACCFTIGACTDDVTELDCATLGGSHTPLTPCSAITCEAIGACCEESLGICTDDIPQSACFAAFYAATACSTITCEPQGACCEEAFGLCSDGISESDCFAVNGTFYDATPCAAILCETLGACCEEAFGFCTDNVTESDCLTFAGTFYDATPCAAIICETFGACCDETLGICTDNTTEIDCLTFAGTFYPDAACSDIPCETLGACCFSDPDARGGSCVETTESECGASGGDFSPAINCGSVTCSPPTTIPPGGGNNGGPSADGPKLSSDPIDRTSQINNN